MRATLPVAITAYGLFNALGESTAVVIESLRQGVTGLGRHGFDAPSSTAFGAVGQLEALPHSLAKYDTRQARLAAQGIDALIDALGRANRRWGSQRVGMVLGTSTGGIGATEAAWIEHAECGTWPATFDLQRQHSMQAVVDLLRVITGIRGPGYVVSTACSSSAKAFASAQRMIAADLVDAVLVGGVDSLCQTTIRGFAGLELVSAQPCRPFGQHRDGLSLGEGAAFAILERRGDARASVLAVGESCDAYHMSAPHPEGLGAKAAMTAALQLAGLQPEQIGFINAHATGTKLNDAAEATAITVLFGSNVPVVATKGYTGHLLGAAGATEVLLCVVALEQGWVPASLGSEPVDEALSIAVCRAQTTLDVDYALSNSFAFGGSNAAVVLGAAS